MKKTTIALLSGAFTVAVFSACLFTSCTKTYNCYSASLEAEHRNDNCPTACPGVQGCDGKAYCNVCEANKKGVLYVRNK